MKDVGKTVLIILAFFVFMGLVRVGTRAFMGNSTPSPEAYDNTFRNAFLSGCEDEGGKASECACGYDELAEMYPDFTTNTERLKRIETEGYSKAETDKVVKCFK